MASETVGELRPDELVAAGEEFDPDERVWITDAGRAALWEARRDEAHEKLFGPWPKCDANAVVALNEEDANASAIDDEDEGSA